MVENRHNEPVSSSFGVVSEPHHRRQIMIALGAFAAALVIAIYGAVLVAQAIGGDNQDHMNGNTSVISADASDDHAHADASDDHAHADASDDHTHEDASDDHTHEDIQ